MKNAILLSILLLASSSFAASLEDQLQALDQGNQGPVPVTKENLYAVQTRYSPLTGRSELTAGGGYNMTPDSFLRTMQFEVGYHFHFNDRWAVAANYAWVDNTFKSETNNLATANGAIPDTPYASSRGDVMAEYNIFYGKFRFGPDTVSYFDVYGALGPGLVQQNTGSTAAAVADVGFAFWIGKHMSTRFGLKDYYYQEQYSSGAQYEQALHAHLDLGYLF